MNATGRTRRGFTLIELLVVIAIIGLLASIVLASLSTAQQKSRDSRRVADIREIQSALELYAARHGTYPTSLGSLVTDGDMQSMPTDPKSGFPYAYDAYTRASGSSACTGYHLAAVLEYQGGYVGSGFTRGAYSTCSGSGYPADSYPTASQPAGTGDGVTLAALAGDFSGSGCLSGSADCVYDAGAIP